MTKIAKFDGLACCMESVQWVRCPHRPKRCFVGKKMRPRCLGRALVTCGAFGPEKAIFLGPRRIASTSGRLPARRRVFRSYARL